MWERGGCGGAYCDGVESLWTAGCLSPNQQASGGSLAHYQALACEHASVSDSTGVSVPPGAAPDGRVGHARARTRTRSHANKQALAQVHPRAPSADLHTPRARRPRAQAQPLEESLGLRLRRRKNLWGSDAVSGWVAADAGQVPQLGAQTPSFSQQRAAKAGPYVFILYSSGPAAAYFRHVRSARCANNPRSSRYRSWSTPVIHDFFIFATRN